MDLTYRALVEEPSFEAEILHLEMRIRLLEGKDDILPYIPSDELERLRSDLHASFHNVMREQAKRTAKEVNDNADREKEMPENRLCVVCMSEVRSHCAVPCGHFCFCGTCVKRLQKGSAKKQLCPICRQHVSSYIKTHSP